jgi:hypothetical protein
MSIQSNAALLHSFQLLQEYMGLTKERQAGIKEKKTPAQESGITKSKMNINRTVKLQGP